VAVEPAGQHPFLGLVPRARLEGRPLVAARKAAGHLVVGLGIAKVHDVALAARTFALAASARAGAAEAHLGPPGLGVEPGPRFLEGARHLPLHHFVLALLHGLAALLLLLEGAVALIDLARRAHRLGLGAAKLLGAPGHALAGALFPHRVVALDGDLAHPAVARYLDGRVL